MPVDIPSTASAIASGIPAASSPCRISSSVMRSTMTSRPKIPPLLLDADEVTTIITSLLVLETWTPGDPAAAVPRAMLEQTLPPALRRRAAATALSTQILQTESAPVDFALVGALSDAVAQGARVGFAYTDQHGHETQRVVEPYRHFLRERHWYVVAYDIDRDDWRSFRLDRMRSAVIRPGTHGGREFPLPSIEAWLTSDFGRIAPPAAPFVSLR